MNGLKLVDLNRYRYLSKCVLTKLKMLKLSN